MKTLMTTLGLAVLATTSFAQAADFVTFNINVKSEMKVKVSAVYQTQKDSFFCKKTVLIDGSIQRQAIVKDVVVQEVTGTGLLNTKIPVDLNDSCKNKLVGMGINLASESPLFENNLSVVYQDSEPVGVQKFLIGPSRMGDSVYYAINSTTIKMGPKETASLSVEVVNFDPLPPRR